MAVTPVVTNDGPNDFYPRLTRRVTLLVSNLEVARTFVMNPASKTLCDRFLLPNCGSGGRYQLHVSAAVEVGPGARKQSLHREEDTVPFLKDRGQNSWSRRFRRFLISPPTMAGPCSCRAATRGKRNGRPNLARQVPPKCRQGQHCSGWVAPCMRPGRTFPMIGATV